MPVDQPYADGYLLTARYYVLAPEQVRYTTQVAMGLERPSHRLQEIYVFLPSLRRSLQVVLFGAMLADPRWRLRCRMTTSKTPICSGRTLRLPIWAPKRCYGWSMPIRPSAATIIFVIVGGVPGWPKNVVGKWELRDAWVIDLTPLPVMGSYCYGHKVIYIDRETLQELNVDIYDVNNKFWKISYSIYGPLKVNANERSLVGGVNQQTMIDFQNQHASESLPPSPGASINDDVPQDYHNAEVLGFRVGLRRS